MKDYLDYFSLSDSLSPLVFVCVSLYKITNTQIEISQTEFSAKEVFSQFNKLFMSITPKASKKCHAIGKEVNKYEYYISCVFGHI